MPTLRPPIHLQSPWAYPVNRTPQGEGGGYPVPAAQAPAVDVQTPPPEAYAGGGQPAPDPGQQYLEGVLQQSTPPRLSMQDASGQVAGQFGPPPTAPKRPSRLTAVLAALGDSLGSVGQIYRGVHPQSARTGPLPQTQYYQTLQDRYSTDLDKYEQDLFRRGLITAQMAPTLVGQAENRAQSAEDAKIRAATALLDKRLAEGKIAGDPGALTSLLETYSRAYLDPDNPSEILPPEARGEVDQRLREVLTSRGLPSKDIELMILAAQGMALEAGAPILSRRGSAAANFASATERNVLSAWRQQTGWMTPAQQSSAMTAAYGAAKVEFEGLTGLVRNIGLTTEQTSQMWLAILQKHLAAVTAPGAAGTTAGAYAGDEGMGREAGAEEVEPGMEEFGTGEGGAPGGMTPPQGGGIGGLQGGQGGGGIQQGGGGGQQQPAGGQLQLSPEREEELERLASDLVAAARAKDAAGMRRLLLKLGYTMPELSKMTSSELLDAVTGAVQSIADGIAGPAVPAGGVQ